VRTSKWSRLLAATFLAAGAHAQATEGGGSVKVLGIDTILPGVMPPPGLMFKTFLLDYRADRSLDASGNARAGVSDFDLHVNGLGLHFQFVWPATELLGAKLMTSMATGFVDSSIAFDVGTPAGRIRRKDSTSAWSDMLLGPLMLGWAGEQVHQIAGLQLGVPIGGFSPAKLANPGRGYFAFVPNYAVTWFPVKGAEVSASVFYLVNRENPDTKYRSGRELAIDYGLGYEAAPGWQVGASGCLYKQLSDDELRGEAVSGGNRGQTYSTGPFVRRFGRGWGITLKWQHEFSVENRAAGNRWVLQGAYKF
jgi:hypothetical protein